MVVILVSVLSVVKISIVMIFLFSCFVWFCMLIELVWFSIIYSVSGR